MVVAVTDVSELTDDVPLVPRPTRKRLPSNLQEDYREHREKILRWLCQKGKDPEQREGYARETIRHTMQRIDQFYRWVWDQDDPYHKDITHEHADQYMEEIVDEDWADSSKDGVKKSLLRYFRWRAEEYDEEPWDTDLSFSSGGGRQPRDYLSDDERRKIRQAALQHAKAPQGIEISKQNRAEATEFISQTFGVPKNEITEEHWLRASSWKFPSLVWTSLDAGLRPIEVERAKVHWVDVENNALRIPQEESSKNEDNWVVALRQQTVEALDRWLDERSVISLYDDTDTLWLTKFEKPYQSQALRRLLMELCDIADIDYEDRQMSWYTIRHSVGTYMTRRRGWRRRRHSCGIGRR